MKLLHPEINLEPGRPAMQPPLLPNLVGQGAAVVRLFNTTNQENSFSVKVECDDPYWLEQWVKMSTLAPSDHDPAAQIQRDVFGTGEHHIRATVVPAGKSRDVVLSFSADRTPEARCGVYPFRIIVEQAVRAGGASRRLPEERGTLIIRPFTAWTVEATPTSQNVGRIRRSKEYELVVKNESNDWLYAEVKLPKEKDLIFECKNVRIAVPPPEPGGESIRRIPVRATTRLKSLIGTSVDQPLKVTLQHLEAPSVPPLQPQADKAPIGAGLGAAVLMVPDKNIATPEPPILTYRPIPKSLTEVGKFLVQNAKGLVFAFIGLVVGGMMLIMLVGNAWRKAVKYEVLSSHVDSPGRLKIRGKLLEWSEITFYDDKGAPIDDLPVIADPHGAGGTGLDLDLFYVAIPSGLNAQVKKIGLHRNIWPNLWPTAITRTWEKPINYELTIGKPDIANPKLEIKQVVGRPITILQSDAGFALGDSGEATIVEPETHLKPIKWKDDEILLFDPGLKPGPYKLTLKSNGHKVDLSLTVSEQEESHAGMEPFVDKPAEPVAATGGSGSNAGGGKESSAVTQTPGSVGKNGTAGSSSSVASIPGYNDLVVGLQTHDFGPAYSAVSSQPETAVTLAIQAMAAAGRGGKSSLDEASSLLERAHGKLGATTGIDSAIVLIADGWLIEHQPSKGDPSGKYNDAIEAAKDGVLPRLVYLDYLKRSNSDPTMMSTLKAELVPMESGLNEAEKKIYDSLK